MPCPLPPYDRQVTPLWEGGPTWLLSATSKASLPVPTPILEAPVAVCMLVTVVQNKFYLSLLYPELDLALREPCLE
uniref:Uncharacterized protein n=1 Tax=Rhinolophus ferrumequinum TaxID=59479 RepID=A0A671G2W4_RHIFE